MRNFIKFGIGYWTRKIELSKSMKLTKGKISLKHEQNSNSSLPERQEAYCDLESCLKCHSHAKPTAAQEKPLQKAAIIFYFGASDRAAVYCVLQLMLGL